MLLTSLQVYGLRFTVYGFTVYGFTVYGFTIFSNEVLKELLFYLFTFLPFYLYRKSLAIFLASASVLKYVSSDGFLSKVACCIVFSTISAICR